MQDAGSTQVGLCSGDIYIHETRYTASDHSPLHSRLKALERHNLTPQSDEDNINKLHTVKPVLSGHSKIDKTKILMTNGSLMKVESIAECYKRTCIKR